MQNFYGIVARDIHKCIGEKGSNFIPFSSSVDMKHFKKITDNLLQYYIKVIQYFLKTLIALEEKKKNNKAKKNHQL